MQPLTVIKITSTGPLVKSWQFFLIGQGFFQGVADGKFDAATKQASIEFQQKHNLQPDGVIGNKSWGVAMQLGFKGVEDTRTDNSGAAFPSPPSFRPLVSNAQRQKIFGTFAFKSNPIPGNPENIKITDGWEKKNIVTISIPQLIKIKGNDRVSFHKLGANQLIKLWSDWDKAGLVSRVLTWDGSFVPRFVRGSLTNLSNHSFGSAFDINVAWNGLNIVPALVGQKGSVRELVQLANKNGFYWGGHFDRLDGMHFEIAKIMS